MRRLKWLAPIILIATVMVVLMAGGAVGLLKLLLSDDGQKRKRQIQMVTLMKPPPPPKIQEKPPEPKIEEKKEEIIEPEPEEPPPEANNDTSDEPPPGNDLGVDAEGSGGGDNFGLLGKKGGRALIGGGGASLMKKYGWYANIIQSELYEAIKKILDAEGGIPKGKENMRLRIQIDDTGRIQSFNIDKPANNKKINQALRKALAAYRISEPPPDDMPRKLSIVVTTSG